MIKKFKNYKYISDYIKEEIELGNSKSFDIDHNLYESGDYLCSSFKIGGDREVVVSSIRIDDKDILPVKGGRHYKTLSNYTGQFGFRPTEYLYVGFSEFENGQIVDKNINDQSTLFKKMSTIVDIIKIFVDYYEIKYIIFKSIENDPETGLLPEYNKRDKFYELFLVYNNS